MERDENIIQYFFDNIEKLDALHSDDIRGLIRIGWEVLNEDRFSQENKKNVFEKMIHIVGMHTLEIGERWTLYWMLYSKAFTATMYDSYEELLSKAYETIYMYFEASLPDDLKGKINNQDSNTIVIVTSQFLGMAHAPTRRVLDYAYVLQHDMGYEVVIYNEAGMHLYPMQYVDKPLIYNFVKQYNDQHCVMHKGEKFGFYQNPNCMLDLNIIVDMLYAIKKLTPLLVLNVGARCITSDLCRNFVKNATIPCSTAIPESMAENLVVCRKLRESDNVKLEKLKPWQSVKEAIFNYIMPDESSMRRYKRADFGFDDNDWIIVTAGNRLQDELDLNFMRMIDTVLEAEPNACFWAIGDIFDKDTKLKGLRNKDRIVMSGCVQDACQAIRLSNVYVQPTRKGGGRAAFEALYYRVPVITTKYGDTWDVCGNDFEVASYEEMGKKIIEYKNNKSVYREKQKISRKRAIVLEDMNSMLVGLMNDLGIKNSGKKITIPDRATFLIAKEQHSLEMQIIEQNKVILSQQNEIGQCKKTIEYLKNLILQEYSFHSFNRRRLDYEIEADREKIQEFRKDEQLVVSLTTFPERMYDIKYVLYSLVKQNCKPDIIVLWLSYEEYPNREADIADSLLQLIRKWNITVKFCNNTRSYKKLIPSLKVYSDKIIVTADDDIFYSENWLKSLYESYTKYHTICCHRAREISLKNGEVLPYSNWKKKDTEDESYLNFMTGAGGVLYYPGCFDMDITNEDAFMECCPNADDIWFWAMAVKNGNKIRIADNHSSKLVYVNPERESGVFDERLLSVDNVAGGRNNIQFKNVIEKYPELLQKLVAEE